MALEYRRMLISSRTVTVLKSIFAGVQFFGSLCVLEYPIAMLYHYGFHHGSDGKMHLILQINKHYTVNNLDTIQSNYTLTYENDKLNKKVTCAIRNVNKRSVSFLAFRTQLLMNE